MDTQLRLLDESLSEKGLVGVTLSVTDTESPHLPRWLWHWLPFQGSLTSESLPLCFPGCQFQPGALSMQLVFTYTKPSKRPFFQLSRTLLICFYHPDLPIPAAGIFFSLSGLLPRSAVILELPSLAHSFLFLAFRSPTSEDFGIHWGSGTLPHEPRIYRSRSLRVRPLSPAGKLCSRSQMICTYLAIFRLQIRFIFFNFLNF